MPTVPLQTPNFSTFQAEPVQDSFKTKAKDKVQDRPPLAMLPEFKPSQTDIMMAVADMHENGRFKEK